MYYVIVALYLRFFGYYRHGDREILGLPLFSCYHYTLYSLVYQTILHTCILYKHFTHTVLVKEPSCSSLKWTTLYPSAPPMSRREILSRIMTGHWLTVDSGVAGSRR